MYYKQQPSSQNPLPPSLWGKKRDDVRVGTRLYSEIAYWVTDRNFNISASVVSSVVLGIALVISLGVNLYQCRARGISKPDKKYSTEELQVEGHQNEGGM